MKKILFYLKRLTLRGSMKKDYFTWLIKWYANQCNGDWEHSYGIKIDTLDNPGWYITIDLMDTEYEGKEFTKKIIERSENDWLRCYIRDDKFEGPCGLYNLPEVLKIFHDWVESF